MSLLTLLVALLLQYPSNHITLKLQSNLFYTSGSLNLDHPITWSLIVDQNMSTNKWHNFVHLWEFVIPLEQPILLGQMALSKYKIETLVFTYECSFMTPLKIWHSKSICTLMHIILNHFQNSMFLLMKLLFTQDPEFLLPSIQTFLEIPLKDVFHGIVLNFQNILIMTKQISTVFLQNTLETHSTMVSRCRNCNVTNILHRI